MQQKQLDNNGFSLIEALIAVAVLVLLGGAGFYVYHRDHSTKTATTVASNNPTQPIKSTSTLPATSTKLKSQTPPPAPNPYTGWKLFSEAGVPYTALYPSNWTVVPSANSGMVCDSNAVGQYSYTFVPSNLTSLEAKWTDVEASVFKDNLQGVFNACVITGQPVPNDPQKLTINGYAALFEEVAVTPAMTGYAGDTTDSYVVTHDGDTVVFSFEEKQTASSNGQYPGFDVTNDNADFVKLVDSIRFTN